MQIIEYFVYILILDRRLDRLMCSPRVLNIVGLIHDRVELNTIKQVFAVSASRLTNTCLFQNLRKVYFLLWNFRYKKKEMSASWVSVKWANSIGFYSFMLPVFNGETANTCFIVFNSTRSWINPTMISNTYV
jgi:hypothetical protein